MKGWGLWILGLLCIGQGCAFSAQGEDMIYAVKKDKSNKEIMESTKALDTATFGGGCFWCTEAIFQSIEGVEQVISGYSGGRSENPSYEAVCSGMTGHAEVIQIVFDPSIIRYEKLLEVFFETHDPTTLNQQGADKGTQYRSVVFYHSEDQKLTTESVIKQLTEEAIWPNPIVTEVSPITTFYEAESYHQDYYRLNGRSNGYCQIVINPKLAKFRKVFSDILKE